MGKTPCMKARMAREVSEDELARRMQPQVPVQIVLVLLGDGPQHSALPCVYVGLHVYRMCGLITGSWSNSSSRLSTS